MITRFTFVLAFLITSISFAQQGINYKALIKDSSGNVVANDLIAIQFQILQGEAMTNVYQETHAPTTDANGIVIVNIGEGAIGSGVYADIDWGADDHYLNVQIDTGGGLTDMGTTQFKTVPYALHAKTAESVTGTCGLSIGDTYAGGIIFYLDSTGCHGLVCAPTDQGTNIPASVETVSFSVHNGIGAGYINTEYIVGLIGDGNYAAKLCYDLSVAGYDDWYLPSKYELDLMFLNIGGGASAPNTNIGNFSFFDSGPNTWPSIYWSSTSYGIDLDYQFWVLQLAGDQIYFHQEFWSYINGTAVRAVRTF